MARSNRGAAAELDRVLRDRLLRTVFQPIVRVESGTVVGYEALMRGPAGSVLEAPDALIVEAYRQDRVAELDWVARASASRAALAGRLAPDNLLFFNIEPVALTSTCPPDLRPDIEEAFDTFRILLEITERSLDHDPRTLIEGIDRQRPAITGGLALDDVGTDVRAMSLLPVVRPDVIKLDLKVTQSAPSRAAMRVLHFAYEEAERTGATMLAEGVETERHAQVVRWLGIPLAQGWLYGKPADDPPPAHYEARLFPRAGLGLEDVRSPYEVLGGQPIGRAPRDIVRSLANEVFRHGPHLLPPAFLLVLAPDPEALTKEHLRVLSQMSRRQVMTGVIGPGIPPEPAAGVRGTQTRDPALDGQYAVIAVSPSTAVAVLARQEHPARPDFSFGIIHDRSRITAAARCLLRHLEPEPPGG